MIPLLATCAVAVLVLSLVTKEDQAREIAARNDRCGHCEDGFICLLPKEHKQEHDKESVERVVPFA